MPSISVLTSLYQSGPYVREFYQRGLEAVQTITDDYEFVFVDDGSPDDAAERVRELIEEDPHVRLVQLSRNFGHHAALMAGLQHTRKDLVFMLDSDLEEDPALLQSYYHAMEERAPRPDVVFGVLKRRKGGWFERVSGWIFYRVFNFFSVMPIPENIIMARLMTRRYVDDLLRYQETNPFLNGIMQLVGYEQAVIPTEKSSKGSSVYSFTMKINQFINAIFTFSNMPLTYVGIGGILIAGFSMVAAIVLLARMALVDAQIEGWMIVLAAQGIFGGLIITAIGITGFYVGRIHLQVKNRPNVIIKEVCERPDA